MTIRLTHLFALGLVASALGAACSGKTSLSLGENPDSGGPDAGSDAPVTSCAARGGTCEAVTPGACLGGRVDSTADCGGVGALCCIRGGGDAGRDGASPDDTACAAEGGQCTTTVCAGSLQYIDTTITCSVAGAHCCVPVKPDGGGHTCGSASGEACTPVGSCGAGQGHLTDGTGCSADSACCVPQAACPPEAFACCSGATVFRPWCEGGALVCLAGTRCGVDGGALTQCEQEGGQCQENAPGVCTPGLIETGKCGGVANTICCKPSLCAQEGGLCMSEAGQQCTTGHTESGKCGNPPMLCCKP